MNINSRPAPFGMSSASGLNKVDEQTVNYVYNRYIDMLQQDKNASIDLILSEEPLASQIAGQLITGPNGTIVSGYTEKDIEQAVIDKLYQEEET